MEGAQCLCFVSVLLFLKINLKKAITTKKRKEFSHKYNIFIDRNNSSWLC